MRKRVGILQNIAGENIKKLNEEWGNKEVVSKKENEIKNTKGGKKERKKSD